MAVFAGFAPLPAPAAPSCSAILEDKKSEDVDAGAGPASRRRKSRALKPADGRMPIPAATTAPPACLNTPLQGSTHLDVFSFVRLSRGVKAAKQSAVVEGGQELTMVVTDDTRAPDAAADAPLPPALAPIPTVLCCPACGDGKPAGGGNSGSKVAQCNRWKCMLASVLDSCTLRLEPDILQRLERNSNADGASSDGQSNAPACCDLHAQSLSSLTAAINHALLAQHRTQDRDGKRVDAARTETCLCPLVFDIEQVRCVLYCGQQFFFVCEHQCVVDCLRVGRVWLSR